MPDRSTHSFIIESAVFLERGSGMTEQDLKAVVGAGFADAMRRSPLAYALVVEALAIAALAWVQIADSKAERAEVAAYVQVLHGQLVECHKRQ